MVWKTCNLVSNVNKWLKPSTEMVKYKNLLIIHQYEDEYGEKKFEMDLCIFDGIRNRFFDKNRNNVILYKQVIAWIPVPEYNEK